MNISDPIFTSAYLASDNALAVKHLWSRLACETNYNILIPAVNTAIASGLLILNIHFMQYFSDSYFIILSGSTITYLFTSN